MVDVVHLSEGEHPPEDKNCLVVLRDTTGGYFVLSSEDSYQREKSPLVYPLVDGERAVAIERARAFASAHGVDVVYVDPE
jgi:hypothetical protein